MSLTELFEHVRAHATTHGRKALALRLLHAQGEAHGGIAFAELTRELGREVGRATDMVVVDVQQGCQDMDPDTLTRDARHAVHLARVALAAAEAMEREVEAHAAKVRHHRGEGL